MYFEVWELYRDARKLCEDVGDTEMEDIAQPKVLEHNLNLMWNSNQRNSCSSGQTTDDHKTFGKTLIALDNPFFGRLISSFYVTNSAFTI